MSIEPEGWVEKRQLDKMQCGELPYAGLYCDGKYLTGAIPLYASPHPIERQAGEFVSVPREPTTEMIYAGIEAMKKAPDLVGIVDNLLPEAVDCYKAMLAAAPAHAAQGDV